MMFCRTWQISKESICDGSLFSKNCKPSFLQLSLHKKWSFLLRISSVNVIKIQFYLKVVLAADFLFDKLWYYNNTIWYFNTFRVSQCSFRLKTTKYKFFTLSAAFIRNKFVILILFSIFTWTKVLFRVLNTAWKVSKYGVFSGPYFPAFGQNMEIISEYRKIRTRKSSVFGLFSRSGKFANL